ncbi:wall-associated receptor kinase 17-like [Typha latifolia]|uniref:wall-associated receptor kinase 17-like n=1 Tax=Typha latifolia TaxID=4733 RepID=UPI003C2BC71D
MPNREIRLLLKTAGVEMLFQYKWLPLLLLSSIWPPTCSAPLLPCTSVPFPFGIILEGKGKALPGFEVNCSDGIPFLQLGSVPHEITNISLQGYVKILAGAVWRGYYTRTMKRQVYEELNLDHTPFTFSDKYNKIIVIGCEDRVSMRRGDNLTSTVCFTICPDDMDDGSCSGSGCCQADLPHGLKSFELDFERNSNSTSRRDMVWSQAFVVQEGEYTFSKDDLLNYSTGVRRPVVLNWAIGNETCEKAISSESYACKGDSDCYDSPEGAGFGYLCNCSQGYEGNPYVQGGCKDINECENQATNPCVGHCINEQGSVSCSCPRGMSGDGRKKGSGCQKSFPLYLVLGVSLGLLFILVTGSFLSYWGLKKRKLLKMKEEFFIQNGGLLLQQRFASQGIDATSKIFTAEELEKATNKYDESQILGRGGSGIVYKGVLPGQRVVAIKRSKVVDESQVEQFIKEITILSQINHRNVVKLLGCCLETHVPLLVYEFISNGTLFHRIHSQSSPHSLPWEHQLRIAAETAGVLAYLHSAASLPIIHGDIKTSNILLDDKYTAKVSDFGASRYVPSDQTHITTVVRGTAGYLDPEYLHTSELTKKSDVYSFGVVLAELLTRERPVSFTRSQGQRNLAYYFVVLVDDGRLLQQMEPQIVMEAGAEQIYAVAQLAKRCLNLKGDERPTMREVAGELERLGRFREQQQLIQQNIEEVKHLPGDATCQTMKNVELSSQFSLEDHLLSSMELPR